MESKKCSKCGELKPLTDFSKDKSKKSGNKSQCKLCLKTNPERQKYLKEYRDSHKEYFEEKHAEYRERNREKLKEQSRLYRLSHPEKSKEYYLENRERILEYSRRYHAKKREEIKLLRPPKIKKSPEEIREKRREYKRKYAKAHRNVENARAKRYRENNPEKIRKQREQFLEKNPDYKKISYDRRLKRLGKTRRPILTEEEKEVKRLEEKEKNRARAHERYLENFVSVEKTCKYCGSPFMTQYKKSKVFCSEECADKHSHYMGKIAEKRRKGRITAHDRLDTDITLPLLFKRDKGICKICGGLCDYKDLENRGGVIIVGDSYPSIDHIKPISKGGSHTWDNVQLAHKLCNSVKADKEA